MLAPTFQNYKLITKEPFEKNGKLYVTVEHPNTHNHRDVRFYSEKEYNKLYGNKETKKAGKIIPWNMKKARGFENGPIVLIRNAKGYNSFNQEEEDWLRRSVARYAITIGWYFASSDTIPTSKPANFKYLHLTFDEFKKDDITPKEDAELSKIIMQKIKKGEWIDV